MLVINMHKNILTVVGITILFLGTCITPLSAVDNVKKSVIPFSDGNIFYVGGTGPGNYTRIQSAVNDANPGDTVFVYNGTYYETVYIDKNDITLLGEDKNITIIDGIGSQQTIRIYNQNNVQGGKISGFTIFNCSKSLPNMRTIHLSADYYEISDNIIIANKATNWETAQAILIMGYHNIIFKNTIYGSKIGIETNHCHNNTISENIINNNVYGIYNDNSAKNTITNNIFYENSYCIYFDNPEYNVINNNEFYNNNVVLFFEHVSMYNIIQNNIFSNNYICISNDRTGSTRNLIYFSLIKNNTFHDNYYGILLREFNGHNNITYNIFYDNYCGISLEYTILHNSITYNIFYNNYYGVSLYNVNLCFIICFSNIIKNNDFYKNNTFQAFFNISPIFDYKFPIVFNNLWTKNYWGTSEIILHRISGKLNNKYVITYDFLPRNTPNRPLE